ncbi:MAG: glycoside hydrolase family 2 TIM barrel-domain containing protein, partial [Clostridia bacterium]
MRKFEDLNFISENRLPQRAYYIPTGEAKYTSLNGKWKFSYFENGDFLPSKIDFGEISVPSCWQLFGFENPNYTNINYPYPYDPPFVPDINPCAVYQRDFFVDITKQTYLVFEGVSSCAEVYCNEKYVGCTQGSHLQAEFDLSNYVKDDKNTLRVIVRKWCSGSYLEDQDFFRFNGIFRDIYILSRPAGHLFDVEITTENDDLFIKTDSSFSATLFFQNIKLSSGVYNKNAVINVQNPALWNAENPLLYTLLIESAGEKLTFDVGFRKFEISTDNELLLNGTPIKLKGINHHDSSPRGGWYMTDEEIATDLKLMKTLNINTIRTSHYPPTPRFLELCDRLGFYVILETDLETHGILRRFADVSYNYDVSSDDWLTSKPEWKQAFLDRMIRAFERDKNHCSVTMWSTGNESGHGKNHIEMMKWLKNRRSTALI